MSRMTIIDSGFYSSIQDLGRKRYRSIGVPHSGAMDQLAAGHANELVANDRDAAVMEIILYGGVYLFSIPTRIAVTGATAVITINDKKVLQNQSIEIHSGDVLKMKAASQGNFLYVAVSGGFQTEEVLGSRSFYNGITSHKKIEKGDFISLLKPSNNENLPEYFPSQNHSSLKCFPGAEFHLLNRKQQESLLNSSFTISKNWNRMAFQLEEKIINSLVSLKSSPVLPGTVQLTPNGRLIVLMRDAQTTGGYPRVLQLEEKAISKMAQKRAGECVDFIIK